MATIYNDTFTTASDHDLGVHSPDTGTSWTKIIAVDTSSMIVQASSDTVIGFGGLSDGALFTADATYDSANYYVQVTQTVGDSGDDPCILAVRIQDANNMYAVRFNNDASQLYKCVASTWSTVGTAGAGIANASVVKLDITGTTLTLYDDGVSIKSATVSDHSLAGKAGLGIGAVILAGDDISSQEMDNFSVVTDTAAAPDVMAPNFFRLF